ncbi:MAG: site-specific integrase [Actinomycetota bacterium]|nr:site-specific integrase [Actinomycetota bacterium]
MPYRETVDFMGELTTRGIDALPIPAEDERQRDHKDGRVPGLILRVFSSGRRSWYLRYRADGILRKAKIGDFPALSLAAARRKAESLRVEVRAGADPVRERMERREADTFGDLVDWYLEEHASKTLAPVTARENERILTGKDLAALRKLPATAVTDADVAKALDRIERRGAMTMINRTQTAISAVYTWATPRRRAGIVSNPVRGLPRRHNERGGIKRTLDESDIRQVFGAIDSIPGVPAWASTALWLILLTGQRPGEVLQAKWAHIDLERKMWKMPKGYRKRVRGQREAPPHDVPLSPLVVDILGKLPGRRTSYVFPSQSKRGHKNTNDLNQRVRRGLLKHLNMRTNGGDPPAKVEPFTPHDLRRTCSTRLHAAGVPRHVVEKTLGHVDSSVAAIYDQHAYWDERTDALNAWAERLRQIIRSGES